MLPNLRLGIWITLVLVGLGACQSEFGNIPTDVLPPERMTQALIQIHIAESKTQNAGIPYDTALVYYSHLREESFKKLGIDTVQFNRSLRFYESDPKLLDKIYESVVDSLGLRNERGAWD
jgi:hypothetical protein